MKQRRALLISVAIILCGIGYLVFGNFGANLVYFAVPSEVMSLPADRYGEKMRVGGLVVKGSLKAIPETLRLTFDLTDGVKTLPVVFEGIPPDLFKEGQGAVVEGYWDSDHLFHSRMIMAKHSEDYMPIEMKKAGLVLPTKDIFKTLNVE